MPVPLPLEFRRCAVEPACTSDKSLAEVAVELGISRSCPQNWVRQAKVDTGGDAGGLTSAEKKEPAELRRRDRQLEVENEVLKRAAAYFARENVLPKWSSGWSASRPATGFPCRWLAGYQVCRRRAITSGWDVRSRRARVAEQGVDENGPRHP